MTASLRPSPVRPGSVRGERGRQGPRRHPEAKGLVAMQAVCRRKCMSLNVHVLEGHVPVTQLASSVPGFPAAQHQASKGVEAGMPGKEGRMFVIVCCAGRQCQFKGVGKG